MSKIPMINTQMEVENFLKKQSELPKIIVIYWPTGSGKTSLSIDVAKQIDSEIISTDSRQIFQYLDIGTGKITEEEKDGVVHHMLDIIPPDREYSVWEFKQEAENIINRLQWESKIPILCWGTGLYIDSLIYDFNIPRVPADTQLRAKLEQQALEFGNEYVYKRLVMLDPEYAKEIHPNNLRYVIRALEIKILTWKSKTEFREEKVLKYDVLFLTPYKWDREALYDRINIRVAQMFSAWLVLEVKSILEKWYKKTDFWMQTIGYKEVIDYLEWNITLEESIEQVQQYNRNYAKRQLTWFRNYEKSEEVLEANAKPLFTKWRILFLIVVFVVFSLPLIYRYLSFLL